MTEPDPKSAFGMIDRLARVAPGLAVLARYRRRDLPHDLIAGLSVAAVAVPVGVAYAELAGFNPAVGLYSSMLPLLAYALFSSSRQLVVGPDAATCALVAAAVAPLAAGDPEQYLSISMTLALLAGLICIAASFFRLGALADFLSRPILAGFMNGIALSIVLGQLGKIFGFTIDAGGIVPRLLEFSARIGETHWPTLAVGAGTFVVLFAMPRIVRWFPAALAAMIVMAAAVALLGLDTGGVRVVGEVPAGLPSLTVPSVPLDALKPLIAGAAGIALISFTSLMLTARSFGAKNGYEVDADRDMAALGAANIAAAVSHGFAVSGADSRTAMNDAAGGRTQVAGLVSAAAIALVLIFLTEPLKYVPVTALGAVLVVAGLSLVDLGMLRLLWREDRAEFAISIVATIGVVAVGSIDAILLVVVLALLRFVRIVARPPVEVLGIVEDMPGFHSIARHPAAKTVPGLCLLRFNSPIVFFNAPYFKRCALEAIAAAGPGLRWLVLDAVPVTSHDVTGRYALRELDRELGARGISIAVAGRQTEIANWRREAGLDRVPPPLRLYPTLRSAVRALEKELAASNS